jgi:hypothetical protein
MGFGQRDSVPSQLTVEAVVNQFRQLLENDGKRTEGYERYLYFRSFSVVFAQLTELIHLCFNNAKEPSSQAKSPSVSSVISVCSVVSFLDLFCELQVQDTSDHRALPHRCSPCH